jgi:protein TonB
MLDVLLESKAPHTRRIGGTLASTLVHGAIITGAVLLTMRPYTVLPKAAIPDPTIHFIPTNPSPAPPAPRPPANDATTAAPRPPSTPLPPIDQVPTTIEPVESNVAPIAPSNLIGPTAVPTGLIGPTGPGAPTGIGEAVDVRLVDKPPRLLRSEQPRFPEALRSRGQNGRIVVQFVVDTLGRAEMSEFKVVDATDAQLADPVRAVLPRFRFTPGEAAGHKVRTLVALPFDFTLVR